MVSARVLGLTVRRMSGLISQVVHSVGPNTESERTVVSMLVCYKDASAIDMQPGSNKRSLAELPVARGWRPCPLFPPGYVEAMLAQEERTAKL